MWIQALCYFAQGPRAFTSYLLENSRLGTDGIWEGLCGYFSSGLTPLKLEHWMKMLIDYFRGGPRVFAESRQTR